MSRRQLGIVLTPAEVQDEGVDRVLDNIVEAGATAISPTLGVYAPGRPGEGSREPPLDVSGQVRLLDRPARGKRELWLLGYAPHPLTSSGRQARMTARIGPRPGPDGTTRTIATSSPVASRWNADAAPSATPK